jgi:translocator protein
MVVAIRKPKLLAASVGGVLLLDAVRALIVWNKDFSWYRNLDKPFLSPPLWLFGPVSLALYICLGISLYLVIASDHTESKRGAYISYGVQMALALMWPLAFFTLEWMWASFVIAVMLIASIIWTMREFNGFHEAAVYLLFSHLVWVSFVTYLNLSAALLNA